MRKVVPFSLLRGSRREYQDQAAALCEAFAACFLAAAFSSSTSKKVFFSPLPRSFWKKLATTAPETLCQSAPTADGKAVDVLKIEGDGAEAVLAEAGFAVLAPEEVYCVDPA